MELGIHRGFAGRLQRVFGLFAYLSICFPFHVHAQHLDACHLAVDAEATGEEAYTYCTFQEAAVHFTDSTTVYIRPGVYWIDDPDAPTVKVGRDGREPFGLVVRCKNLHLIGMGDAPQDVVLASQRGQTQGAVGNFTMFDFWCNRLEVENMTLGNYCNVDLVYPQNPRLNRQKRNSTITQAHVGYVHGDSLIAKNVRFISRLNLNPLNGARHSYYESCHFECTDDALNGNATYRHCDFDFYGSKPWWSTHGRGALLIDCDFYAKNDNRETYFCKQGGPLTLINCRYHAPSDSTYIGWTAYPQPWLRCYQQGFTLNGRPYVVGQHQPDNTVILPDSIDFSSLQTPPYMWISRHEAEMQVGKRDTIKLHAHADNGQPVYWTTNHDKEIFLSNMTGDSVTIAFSCGDIAEPYEVPVTAISGTARAVCMVKVKPAQLPPPDFTELPHISIKNGMATLHYALDLNGLRDESRITWQRNGIPISVSHESPQCTYTLTEADRNQQLTATIEPKSSRSLYGTAVTTAVKATKAPKTTTLSTDFHDFPCQWQPVVKEGYWTVDGYKPADTKEFDWTFDRSKPMWEYREGFNGAVGKGLLQAQRGARLMYTPVKRTYGNMSLSFQVDPTKTAGQGFGSATGQYMDVCLKFDTQTLTGYGLRIIRTTKHAKAVDFLLVKYDHGRVTALTEPVSATCYRTGCTISVDFIGSRLIAHVDTKTPQPADSTLPYVVDLYADVTPNAFGGIHIQHTGSCGESTTMLHRLQVEWK